MSSSLTMENQLNAVRSESPILVDTRSSEDARKIKNIKKQQIRQIFSGLNKVGYLHKLAPYEYDTAIETDEYWKIEIADGQDRMSLIRNQIKVEMDDERHTTKLLKMETSLNKLYGEMKRYDVSDGVLAFQNIPPGLLVAVCDDSVDHVGRFRRGRVIQTVGKDGPGSASGDVRSRSLEMVKCELIDEGRVDIFPSDHLYLLATKFLTPARFFTIQLADLQRFEGSPKFARVFEAMLETYGYQYYMTILKKGEPPHQYQYQQLQVILTTWKLSATVTVNDYLLSELFKMDDPDIDRLLSPTPGKSSIFSDTVLCNVKTEEGPGPGQVRVRIGLCEKSREMETISDLLSDAQDRFSSYLAFYKGRPEQERLSVGDICVALHPDDGKALRCKILWEPFSAWVMISGKNELKTFVVGWMDIGIGLETEILALQLIPAFCVSPILAEAQPRCKEFQLANVKKVKNSNSNSDSLLSVLSPGKEVAARVLGRLSTAQVGVGVGVCIDQDRTPGQSSNKDPAPLVDLCTYKMGREGDQVDSLNTKLIKMGLSASESATGTDQEFVFSPKKFVEPSGLLQIPMNYPLVNWAPRSYKRWERDHLMVSKGDEITFFVSDLLSPTDFTIHPSESEWAVQHLESQLHEYFEDTPWAVKEGDASLTSLPSGNFFIYNKGDGLYSRVKLIPKDITDGLELELELKTGNNMVRLLLLEKGRYEKAECKNVIGIGPFCPMMSTLPPQGAVGRWKDAVDQVAKFRIDLKLKKKSPLEIQQSVKCLEKTLGSRLEKEFPNVKTRKAMTASVASVNIDENGRAEFELILKHTQNDDKENEN